jgi:NADH:ubiquinone oxidoreductase subunit K
LALINLSGLSSLSSYKKLLRAFNLAHFTIGQLWDKMRLWLAPLLFVAVVAQQLQVTCYFFVYNNKGDVDFEYLKKQK